MNKLKVMTVTLMLAVLAMTMSSCFMNKRKPGWEYMPDMAHSVAYETYSETPYLPDSMTNQKMPKGTFPLYYGFIGRLSNYKPYYYSNSTAGYDSAGLYVNDTVFTTPDDIAEGQRNFLVYCAVCHGKEGKADGTIVNNPNIKNPFPPPPSYYDKDKLALPIGKMFHTVHYGKGLMGSYASQLDQKQIWQILHFVKSMQADYLRAQAPAPARTDSTKKA